MVYKDQGVPEHMSNSDSSREVYDFIQAYLEANQGYAPSIREIAGGVYLGRSTVMRHLDKLEAWGYIERQAHRPRSIRITEKAWPRATCNQKRDKCPDRCPPQNRTGVLL
jgi:DNA-binding MarR family transcriptional regulator